MGISIGFKYALTCFGVLDFFGTGFLTLKKIAKQFDVNQIKVKLYNLLQND